MDSLSNTLGRDDSVLSQGSYEKSSPMTYTCINCGKNYSAPHHLDAHQIRSCASTKRTLSELLGETRVFWEARKRRRRDTTQENEPSQTRPDASQCVHEEAPQVSSYIRV